MRKIIKFGKIDYLGIGKKTCPVEVEVSLADTKNGPEFTASATVWNHKHTDCYQGGQCLDSIAKFFSNNKEYEEILRLWRLYHLNGMHAGTEAQEAAIDKWEAKGNTYDYKEVCKYLESINLLVEGDYQYGTGWLYRAIPEADLQKIKNIVYNS